MSTIEVFFSYSHKDENLREVLAKHFARLTFRKESKINAIYYRGFVLIHNR